MCVFFFIPGISSQGLLSHARRHVWRPQRVWRAAVRRGQAGSRDVPHDADAQGAEVHGRDPVRERVVRELDGAGRGWATRALQLLSHRVLRQVILFTTLSCPGCHTRTYEYILYLFVYLFIHFIFIYFTYLFIFVYLFRLPEFGK